MAGDPVYPISLRAGACANGQTICWQLMVGNRVAKELYSSNLVPEEAFIELLRSVSNGQRMAIH